MTVIPKCPCHNAFLPHACRMPATCMAHACRMPTACMTHACRTPSACLPHAYRIPPYAPLMPTARRPHA